MISNNTECSLDFTYNLKNNILPFLDILKINHNKKQKFKVHNKSTNRKTIYVFTHIITNTESGIIMGFYLRILRICSPKSLNDEFIYIMSKTFYITIQNKSSQKLAKNSP